MNLMKYINLIKTARLGLMLLCLMLLGSGCANKECPPARPMLPPTVLMQEVPEPRFTGRTNADLLTWSLELRQALRLANADKMEMRRWIDEVKSLE